MNANRQYELNGDHKSNMTFAKRITNKVCSIIRKKVSQRKEKEIIRSGGEQISEISLLSKPYFMVGIPGSVHLLQLSAKYLPDYLNLVLISNGMDEWEVVKALDLVKPVHLIKLDTQQVIPHGKVLDMLFDYFTQPFGILDYDCFVFDPECFRAMADLNEGQFLNTMFFQKSPMLGKTPQTFFLFFNAGIVQEIRKKYKVNSGITDFSKGLPRRVIRKLKEIGIDEHNYPENGKPYFDTFRLIYALGVAEGYTGKYLEQFQTDPMKSADVFHVGGVANPNTTYGWWGVRGSYFWWRALESCDDNELKLRYKERFGNRSSQNVFNSFPEYREKTGQNMLDFYETLFV